MRKTIVDLRNGVYQYDGHVDLSDRGARRYHPFSFDFDSTPTDLKEPEEHWDDQIKKQHIENRKQFVEWLKLEYGANHIDNASKNAADLGPKSFSMLVHHNQLHEQTRRAFVAGDYYPALVAACALGGTSTTRLTATRCSPMRNLRKYIVCAIRRKLSPER